MACVVVCLCLLQHPSGYEASLDPWLQQLWAVLRAHNPLPPGVSEVGAGVIGVRQLWALIEVCWLSLLGSMLTERQSAAVAAVPL